jgi:hypothetical protein
MEAMLGVHVKDDKLKLLIWACREIISSISEAADDIYKQEIALQQKNKAGKLPPLCAIVQVVPIPTHYTGTDTFLMCVTASWNTLRAHAIM